jgi:hypothetical protein
LTAAIGNREFIIVRLTGKQRGRQESNSERGVKIGPDVEVKKRFANGARSFTFVIFFMVSDTVIQLAPRKQAEPGNLCSRASAKAWEWKLLSWALTN